MKKSLLQEAIAEAKQVREAAIKNATKELEENLTPSIKEMLANKLEEELDLNEADEESLDESVDSGFKEVKPKSAPKKNVNEEDDPDEDAAEEDADDADAAADNADAAAEDADAAADAADDAADDADASAEDEAADDETPLKDITLGDLKQIISDLVAASAAPAPEGDLGADMDAGDVEGAGEEIPAGDPAAAADDVAADMPADTDADPTAEDDDEIDISEILRELEEEEKNAKNVCPKCGKEQCICKENKANDIMPEDQTGKEHCKPANADSGKDQDQELNELRKENQELKEGLKKCTKTLKEVNLLNAKLAYASKLLRHNLSEAQKANVIKTLDKAKSTEEAQTLYSTLLEGLKESSKTMVTEGRRGSASKAAGQSTASGRTVDEGMVRRFQQLAGIIKE